MGTDAKGQSNLYDTRSGTILTIVLLFALCWMPPIGPVVAGFVGGRRAGSPFRGLVSGLVGTGAVMGIMLLAVSVMESVNAAVLTDPEGEIAEVAAMYPFLQQVLDMTLSYARSLFGNHDFNINYGVYAITIPFGIIGGVVADQAQKEARLLVTRTERLNFRNARSIDSFMQGKEIGFETYDRYCAMSVNTMPSQPKVSAKRDVPEIEDNRKEIPRVDTVRRRDVPVTATVDTTRIQASSTSFDSGTTVHRKEPVEEDVQPGEESTVYI